MGFASSASGSPYFIIGSGSYERVPWYGVQNGAGAILLALGALALLMLIGGAFLWRRGRLAGWGKLVLGGSAARIGFVGTLAGTLVLMDPQMLFYGMPLGVAMAVGLGLISLGFDLTSLIVFVRTRGKSGLGILIALVYFASTATFAWWLSYWNLLGWQT